MRLSLLLPALLLAPLLATPALAQDRTRIPTPPGGGDNPIDISTDAQPPATVIAEPVALMIAGLDSDGDARVTRAEFEAGLRRSFDSADSAHSGAIGYIAYSDWSERWMGDRNTLPSPFEIDRDGDNRISWDEFHDRFEQVFARFDKDRDGVLVRTELVTIRPPAFAPIDRKRRGNRR
ncbi:EF-hand domain-containing protein [Sphingomonas sp. RS6]